MLGQPGACWLYLSGMAHVAARLASTTTTLLTAWPFPSGSPGSNRLS
jgi:hypothetical protein